MDEILIIFEIITYIFIRKVGLTLNIFTFKLKGISGSPTSKIFTPGITILIYIFGNFIGEYNSYEYNTFIN